MIQPCAHPNWLLALVVSIVPVMARAAELSASLEVAIDGPALAGQPLLLKLTLKNVGTETFSYWCGGPDRYPPAEFFTAVLVDSNGNQRKAPLSNSQYQEGSGSDIRIAPGETVTFPAAAEPLPPGTWVLRSVTGEARGYFRSPDKPMTVTWPAIQAKPALRMEVRQDEKAAAAFANDLLRRVRKDEPFGRHVATHFRVAVVIDAARRDLESDEPTTVINAVDTLFQLNPLPPGLGASIKRSMAKQLNGPLPHFNAVAYLADLAVKERSDDALDALLAYVRADFPGEGDRRNRLPHLFSFDQPRARDALRAALKDPHLAPTAAAGLARFRDPAALPVLLDVARDRGHIDRASAFRALADYYWDAPAAVAALKEAAADPKAADAARADAQRALQSALDAKARAAQAAPNAPRPK